MKRKTVIATLALVVMVAFAGSLTAFAQGTAPQGATTKSLSTNYTVMNLGTGLATVHVDYMKSYNGTTPGGTWTAAAENTDFTLAVNTSKVVAQYSDSTLTAGSGSAIISSDQPVAGIVNMLARGQVPTSGSYTAFLQGANSFFMPFAFKNLSSSVGIINSQLIVMNVGSAPTNVSIDLINATDGLLRYTKTINNLPVGESFTYDQSTESDANLPSGWQGSAKITATTGGGLIAAVGNQFTGADGLLTYQGFPTGAAQWVVPFYMSRLTNGFNSIIAIQNVGADIAIDGIAVTFTPDDGTPAFTIKNASVIKANQTFIVNPRANPAFPLNSQGSAFIDATGNSVVAIVNQLRNETSATASSEALSYNAIPANLAGHTVVAPMILSRLTNGFSAVFTVANMSNAAGTCDFTYTHDPSFTGISDVSIPGVALPASGSIRHNLRSAGVLPAGWQGSVKVGCTQNVAGIVNLIQAGQPGDPDLSYNAFTLP